jgi:D-3-phosphoglycerate dehydrogenase
VTRRILVTDYAWPDLDVERAILAEAGVELVAAPNGDEDTLTGLAPGCCGILTCWAQTTRAVIRAALPDLRVIVRYGVGLDNIDIAFATASGIPVAYVPDYCVPDVAEHTMALLLALSRKVVRFDRSVREGKWNIQSSLPLRRLTGRTLGLIGFGRVAREVVPRAQAFGMNVIAYSASLTPARAEALGVTCVSLRRLLAESDFVSVHVPSTDATRSLIDDEALAGMKPTACLINTSRGDVIDENALAAALETGRLGGAALDVRGQEPPDAGDRLIRMEQVIHTPHAAFYSEESLVELRERAAREVVLVLQGRQPVNLVNPEYRAQAG